MASRTAFAWVVTQRFFSGVLRDNENNACERDFFSIIQFQNLSHLFILTSNFKLNLKNFIL